MKTWQIVKRSWRLAKKGIRVVWLVAAIQLALSLMAVPFVARTNELPTPVTLLFVLAQFFLVPWIQGGCLSFANATLVQPPAPFASFILGAKRLYGRLLGFQALLMGIVLAVALLAAFLFGLAALPAQQAPALSAVLILLAAVPVAIGLYLLFLTLTMGPAVIAVENARVFQGLVKGLAFGRAALRRLLLVTLTMGLTLVPVSLIPLIPVLFQPDQSPRPFGPIFIAVVLQSLAGALSMVLYALTYVQLYRHRAELVPSSPSRPLTLYGSSHEGL